MSEKCLAYGIDGHDCAEHPDTLSVAPEPCTSYSYKRKHYSIDLTPTRYGGRSGDPICGTPYIRVYDQEYMDDEADRYSGKPWAKPITDLPECKRCAKKAALANHHGTRP